VRTAVIVGQNYPDGCSDTIVERHDRTLIFEPLPEAAAACRERYKDNPKVIVFEAACGAWFSREPFTVYNVNGLSSSLGSVTDDAKRLFYTQDLAAVGSHEVQVCNLGDVLAMLGIDSLAVCVIDAQGMDFTILQTLNKLIEASAIEYIQLEADGEGFRHYDGLPDNSEATIARWMKQFPQYELQKLPGRVSFHPDLVFLLNAKNT
jgi:FkbM family methyltransferase